MNMSARTSLLCLLLAIAMLLTLCFCGCSSSTEASKISISFKSPVATGYQWTYDEVPNHALNQTDCQSKSEHSSLGGLRTDTYTFEAESSFSGKVKLNFKLERPWLDDNSDSSGQVITYEFDVKNPSEVFLIDSRGTIDDIPVPMITL